MYNPILISAFSLLTLATCQNPQTKNETSKTETSVSTAAEPKSTETATKADDLKGSATTSGTQSNVPPQKKSEPVMAPGLPPDKAAVETAKKEAEKNSADADKGGIIYLKEGENRFLKKYEMNITFKKMIEDSRCPKGVNCIWAGNATAEIELMGTYTRPMTINLSSTNDAKRGTTMTRNFNGYDISLVTVSPETTSEKGFKALQGKYKIGLKISKGGFGDGVTTK